MIGKICFNTTPQLASDSSISKLEKLLNRSISLLSVGRPKNKSQHTP